MVHYRTSYDKLTLEDLLRNLWQGMLHVCGSLRTLEQAYAADGHSHGQACTTPAADPQLRSLSISIPFIVAFYNYMFYICNK